MEVVKEIHARARWGLNLSTCVFFFFFFFLYIVGEGRDDPHPTKSGPSLNVGLAALQFFRESGSVLLRDPILWYFHWGYGTLPPLLPPSRSAHENKRQFRQ